MGEHAHKPSVNCTVSLARAGVRCLAWWLMAFKKGSTQL